MTLRRKIIVKDLILVISLALLIAAALWGFNRQRQHVQAALTEYSALKQVEQAAAKLCAFQRAVHAGNATEPDAITNLRGSLTSMSQYKATLSQYDNNLPPEITPELQSQARTKTKTLVTGLVAIVRQMSSPAAQQTNSAALSAAVDDLSQQAMDLLSICNGFVHRTELESDGTLHIATRVIVSTAAAILAVAIAGSFWEYQRVIIPLRRLRLWSKQTAAGDFSARFNPTSDGEFQELAIDINQMADELREFYQKLESMVARKSRELVQSERLASVGYLAAGVAHEINNPLNVITGYAELTLKQLRRSNPDLSEEEIAHHLNLIRSEAFRCKEITTRLLSLAKGNSDVRETISLSDAADNVATLVRGLKSFRNKHLQLIFDPDESLCVHANLTEMKQVLLNLLVNAIEATAEGGQINMTGTRGNGIVELEVSDNGRGMTRETLERVFEPFFTNKRGAGAPGTGLGLSISFAIIENHNGTLHVDSEGPGQGSRFTIKLPAVSPTDCVSKPAPTQEVEVAV